MSDTMYDLTCECFIMLPLYWMSIKYEWFACGYTLDQCVLFAAEGATKKKKRKKKARITPTVADLSTPEQDEDTDNYMNGKLTV